MTVRLAAALLILLPACASCLASPIGALVGPFAGQVLAQQRQEANDKAAERHPAQAVTAICQPERDTKHAVTGTDAKPRCEMPAEETVAARTRTELDPLPQADKKRAE